MCLVGGWGAQAPAVIIAEDDFLFSPDFYEYFHATAPVLVRAHPCYLDSLHMAQSAMGRLIWVSKWRL